MKLCVAGCSFSDYAGGVDNIYGAILAEKLNADYIHHGAGCGSNYRIWREVSKLVISKEITPQDILIIQYTEVTRTEFWSSNLFTKKIAPKTCATAENYNNDGSILRYKSKADTWQNSKTEKEFFKMYESNFLNPNFEEEKFKVYNEMFQHLLLNYKIPTIFLNNTYRPNCNMLRYFENLSYSTTITSETQLSTDDPWHLSLYGHTVLANNLYDHIVAKDLV
jgi:hypothetical protein